MRKNIVILVSIIFCCHSVFAQKNMAGTDMLKIGDKMFPYKFDTVVNYSNSAIELKQYEDRLLILDFWAPWCAPCVAAFPRIDSLQAEFGNRIKILGVTGERRDRVVHFFDRTKKHRNFQLPSAIDSRIAAYFVDSARRAVGTTIWINKGSIAAFTTEQEITARNIERILSGASLDSEGQSKIVDLPRKYDNRKPILTQLNFEKDSLLRQSVLTRYLRGMPSTFKWDFPTKDKPVGRYALVNWPIASLYSIAYKTSSYKTIVEVKDAESVNPKYKHYDSTNLYCYEITTPAISEDGLFKAMQQDMDRYFGYRAGLQKRPVSCIVVRRFKHSRLSSSGGTPKDEHNNFYLTLKNQPFSRLTGYLEKYLLSQQIPWLVDETGIKPDLPIDISLDTDLKHIDSVNRVLQPYGLTLSKEQRNLEMLVVTDNPVRNSFDR